MNKQKRKDLDRAHDLIVQAIEIISSIAGEEQDSYYNLPDSLQSSYMGECLQSAVKEIFKQKGVEVGW